MPPPILKPELMVNDIIRTLRASNKEPKSNSDWTYCVIGLLTKYEVKLRVLPIERSSLYTKKNCHGLGELLSDD